MANYDSSLTGTQIESALEAVHGLIVPANNGKIICVDNGVLAAKSAIEIQGGTIDAITITENGTYTHSAFGGYSPVTVNVDGSSGRGTPYSGTTPPPSSLGLDGNIYEQAINHGILSSDGASYINPSIIPNALCRIETEFAVNTAPTNWDTVFGTRNGSRGRFTVRFDTDNNTLGYQISKTYTDSSVQYEDDAVGIGVYNVVSLSIDSYKLNKKAVRSFTTDKITASSLTPFQYGVYVFALNDAGTAGYFGCISIKYLKFYNEFGVLQKYLVSMEDSESIPCMYDMVNGTYYYNAGTGSFTYSNTPSHTAKIIWEKINGAWVIVGET